MEKSMQLAQILRRVQQGEDPTKLRYEKQALEINGLTKEFLRENGVSEKSAIKLIKDFIEKDEEPMEMICISVGFIEKETGCMLRVSIIIQLITSKNKII